MDIFQDRIARCLGLSAVAVIAAVALPATSAYAQQSVELEEIIISAGRTPLSAQRLGRSHTVITRDELKAKQVRTAAEALELVPGINVSRGGGFSGTTQIRMRGAEGNHVLVLLDGIEISDPNLGEFYWEGLPASSIERIEVVRGPQSTLWGSNAMAGVISITTTSDAEVPPQAFLEIGQRNSVSGSTEFGFETDRATARLSVGYYSTDGNDISGSGGELDGISSLTPALAVSGELTESIGFSGNLRYLRRESEYDGFRSDVAGNLLNRQEWFGALELPVHRPGSRVRVTPRIEQTRYHQISQSSSPSERKSNRSHVSAQVDVAVTEGTPDTTSSLLSMVGEWEQENNSSCPAPCTLLSPSFEKRQRTLRGLAAEFRTEVTGIYTQVGARYDNNDRFQNARTWSAAVSVPVTDHGLRLHASAGTAVTNPTFGEQFDRSDTGFGAFVGNPHLHPEESFGWDFGVEHTFDGTATVDVTVFGERLKDEIDGFARIPSSAPNPNQPCNFTDNICDRTAENEDGTSRRRGLELSVAWAPISDLHIDANYTYTDSKNPDGSREVRRPPHQASLRLEKKAFLHPDHWGFVSFAYTGTRLDGGMELAPTPLTTVGGSFHLDSDTELHWRFENLFDEEVEPILGYFGPGRSAFLGVRKQF